MALMLSSQTGTLPRPYLLLSGRRPHLRCYATLPHISLKLSTKPQASTRAHHAAPKPPPSPITRAAAPPVFSGPTQTATTLFALAFAISRVLIRGFSLPVLPAADRLALGAAGTLFFAAARGGPGEFVTSPMGVVASGVAKWIEIYSQVLMIRVLLSWFPNIPWDRQPMTAIRDLCDPYLNLFRNILPPVFDTLDVSPILAFAVLGLLSMILAGSGT